MRHRTCRLAALLAAAGLAACAPRESEFAGGDPGDVNLAGMNCTERSAALRDIIDRR
jgi:hypothetical protein